MIKAEAQKIIRDRGRAIFLGDVGIGKTSIVLQESMKLADKLDKEYVMVNELLARYGREKLLEVFEKAAGEP